MSATKFVIGNWKMHGRLSENAAWLAAVAAYAAKAARQNAGVRIGVCVPYPYLSQAQAMLSASPVQWGAQDVSSHRQGAYTGEISAEMVSEFGGAFTLVGHSERRAYHGESDALVATKAVRALQAGLTPIVCVGEQADARAAGRTEAVIEMQLQTVLEQLTADQVARLIVAYEPVWAIGTGQSATVEQAQSAHAFLRTVLAAKASAAAQIPVLYGGSVTAANALALFRSPDINGGLIGGASLRSDDFLSVCAAAYVVVQDDRAIL